jgi:uncharacterized membrane protein
MSSAGGSFQQPGVEKGPQLLSRIVLRNRRNAELLRRAATQPYRETQQARLYVAGIIGGTVVLLLLAIVAVLWIVVKLWAAVAL